MDTHTEAPCDASAALERAGRLDVRLQHPLGEQRIDIVTCSPGNPEEPIRRVARASGVRFAWLVLPSMIERIA